MPKDTTIFQRLSNLFTGTNNSLKPVQQKVNSYDMKGSDILFRTTDKEEYETKLMQYKQQRNLSAQWRKANIDISNKSIVGLNEVKMMYRDADLMDGFPEIGTALDIVSEEATYVKPKGFMVNVTSKSERIKSILQDLLVNRLQVNIMLPMICRSMCKYGNTFLLLDISNENGVTNWRQLPVYEIERFENGMTNPYESGFTNLNNIDLNKNDSTKFVWVGQNEFIPYRNWQIAHFRLLYDSLRLPFGVSYLNKARRHWRMLSMMEDMMLIYRMERSVERRVFKINVGAIDDADVPAFIDEIANNFKRTPIIDPMTGQLDLKKNIMCNTDDYFIPVRSSDEPNPIETLAGAQNMTAMDDIKYVQNKLVTALRVPKSFLNYEETAGEGKNLSLLDVRFMRTVNRVQQFLIMELNKVCIIHLFLLGFEDDLTNFTLTMNNPSSQAEMLELENLAKKITTAKDAVSDAGNGIPLMSVTRACREILGWSDKEIEDNLEELRLEKALAAELERTSEIIKRTGIFDPVDNIYGEPGAEYSEQPLDGEGGEGPGGGMGGGGGAIGGGMPMGGDDIDFGDEDDIDAGQEGEMDMETAAQEEGATPDVQGDEGGPGPIGDSVMARALNRVINDRKILSEGYEAKRVKYNDILKNRRKEYEASRARLHENVPIYDKGFLINEDLHRMVKQLESVGENINKVASPTIYRKKGKKEKKNG